MSTPIILMEDIRVSLGVGAGRTDILKGASFQTEAGRSVAILGPSGSGKSTLLMAMAGLEQVNAGRITIAGAVLTDLDEDGLARFRRSHVGIVFQSFHLIPNMTAIENVAIPLELAGEAKAFARAEAELRSVGLGHRLHHYPAELSGGEQQRVAIARALVAQPAILIADEPTGNLDAATGQDIVTLLFETQAARGMTLVLVTHDERLAARCQRIVRVSDGRIVETETAVAGSQA